MLGAGPQLAAGLDARPVREETAQPTFVLVADSLDPLDAEAARLASRSEAPFSPPARARAGWAAGSGALVPSSPLFRSFCYHTFHLFKGKLIGLHRLSLPLLRQRHARRPIQKEHPIGDDFGAKAALAIGSVPGPS